MNELSDRLRRRQIRPLAGREQSPRPLAALTPGARAVVVGLREQDSALARRLCDLGFTPGTEVEVAAPGAPGRPGRLPAPRLRDLPARPAGRDHRRRGAALMHQHHSGGSGHGVLTDLPQLALVGNPNSGKSSVFNRLTGLRSKTGNYPGVTVGAVRRRCEVDGAEFLIEDLPGTYSLEPISPDEQIVVRPPGGAAGGTSSSPTRSSPSSTPRRCAGAWVLSPAPAAGPPGRRRGHLRRRAGRPAGRAGRRRPRPGARGPHGRGRREPVGPARPAARAAPVVRALAGAGGLPADRPRRARRVDRLAAGRRELPVARAAPRHPAGGPGAAPPPVGRGGLLRRDVRLLPDDLHRGRAAAGRRGRALRPALLAGRRAGRPARCSPGSSATR